MPQITFPYGKGSMKFTIPKERWAGTLTGSLHRHNTGKSEEQLVKEALEHPIGTPRLCELARGKQKIVILASDHTRPVPSRIIAPLMLAEIRGDLRRDYLFDRHGLSSGNASGGADRKVRGRDCAK